jgi:hypothetical protein
MRYTLILSAIGIACAASSVAVEPPRSKIKRFVQQVTLGPEFGSNRKVVSRWMSPPTLTAFGATPEQKRLIEEVVQTINPALKASGKEIKLLADAAPDATIKVYFAPLQAHSKIARDHGATYEKGNLGTFWMFWDAKNVITHSLVLLASDKLDGNRMRHFAFEEITQSLGLAEDSDEFRDSIFYARGNDGGDALLPSAIDLQLLDWFYQHVQPGDDRKTVSAKFEQSWPNQQKK